MVDFLIRMLANMEQCYFPVAISAALVEAGNSGNPKMPWNLGALPERMLVFLNKPTRYGNAICPVPPLRRPWKQKIRNTSDLERVLQNQRPPISASLAENGRISRKSKPPWKLHQEKDAICPVPAALRCPFGSPKIQELQGALEMATGK